MQISVFIIRYLEQACADQHLCYSLSGGTSLCRSAALLFAVWNQIVQISIFGIRRLEPDSADQHLC